METWRQHYPSQTPNYCRLIILQLFLGFAAFMNILREPRFQNINSLDVVRPIAIGACWGVAVAGLALLMGSKFRKG